MVRLGNAFTGGIASQFCTAETKGRPRVSDGFLNTDPYREAPAVLRIDLGLGR
jgi:hypothetical protein